MDREQNAEQRLREGDRAIEQLARGRSAREIAETEGVSREHVAKAVWLSRRYPTGDRTRLGPAVLCVLTPSHLEVAAKCDPGVRQRLLERAAAEKMTVRALKQLARQHSAPPATTAEIVGAAQDLSSARRALETYASWDEPSLSKLLAGPNGPTIQELARAGQALAARLEGESWPPCA